MYSVKFSKNAKNFLKKVPRQDHEIILKKIYSLRDNPFRFLKRLRGRKLWRLRVLKYRAIIDVVVSGRKIIVLRIGYRKDVYKEKTK
ncbi:type II toxin-antitoxin system RelE/ParE family toxin [Candidatus Pacearchaeota archaeon]|nr:type II toxin-antitoxin system RelE/ParE family toxin [Candidatus Pacearchaeota archaeon]